MFDVNLWAVLVAAVAAFAIGMTWYSPSVFGKKWMGYLGFTEESLKENMQTGMGMTMVLGFVSNLVMALVLSNLAVHLGKEVFADALGLGFWMWLGFVATVSMGSVLWEKKPWGLWFLNNAYSLLMMLVMSAIVVLWK